MNSPTIFALLLASSASLAAQDPLSIVGLDSYANGNTLTWQQDIEDAVAALKYDELPGEHTLLFVHVTIDETVAGATIAKGVTSALPFLASPTQNNWQLTAPELAALPNCSFTGEAPMVPPRRIANHIAAFLASNSYADYGTSNSSNAAITTQLAYDGMLAPLVSNPADERRAWHLNAWSSSDSTVLTGNCVFDTTQLGYDAVRQAAYEYTTFVPSLPPVNDEAIDALNFVMSSKLGFEIYVQAAHVKPAVTPSSGIDIRLTRHARIRRLSLLTGELEGYQVGDAGSLSVPHPSLPGVEIWLAPRGQNMHIIFPDVVGTIQNPVTVRAYVPTTSGVVAVDQIANPVVNGVLQGRYVAVFPCPVNTRAGIVQFERISNPGVAFPPTGHLDRGALIHPFNPPAGQ
jgi:hypothetical protein